MKEIPQKVDIPGQNIPESTDLVTSNASSVQSILDGGDKETVTRTSQIGYEDWEKIVSEKMKPGFFYITLDDRTDYIRTGEATHVTRTWCNGIENGKKQQLDTRSVIYFSKDQSDIPSIIEKFNKKNLIKQLIEDLTKKGIGFYSRSIANFGGGAPTYTTRQDTTLREVPSDSIEWSFDRQFRTRIDYEGNPYLGYNEGNGEQTAKDVLGLVEGGEQIEIGHPNFGSLILSKQEIKPSSNTSFGSNGGEA